MEKKKYYPDIDQNLEFPKMEESILEFWNNNKIFEKSIDIRKDGDEFVFYDGPPFATGLPHYGHLVASYTKDTVARYQTMNGKKVERVFGWDCHGLPAEMGVEKETGISGRKNIEEYGVDKFNDICKSYVTRYINEWKQYVNRSGRWVDFDNGYKTMNLNYMESVIWVFKQLYDKGLVYEDFRVMPYSWTCQTPVSNAETKQDNSYREKADKAITVKFRMTEDAVEEFKKRLNDLSTSANSQDGKKQDNIENNNSIFNFQFSIFNFLAWTTTPWTLPSNLALAVNRDYDYVILEKDGEYYIIGKETLPKYKKELADAEGNFNILVEFKGEKLLGLHYEPILPYIKNLPEVQAADAAFSVLHGDYVTTTDGTGIVHTAPGFGEDDNLVCKTYGIPTVCPVDDGGCFIAPIDEFVGKQVFETNDLIIIKLKEEGKWLKTEQYLHNYPHCWRTDAPLIYRALPSWYVNVEKIKDLMIKNNQEINWIPAHVKDGRFGKWLEGARDWSISRNRFFGCPIPVWKSDNPDYPRIEVYGSIKELEEAFNVKISDLHRPFIDQLTRPNPDDPTGKSKMVRVTDVMDCWFESGSMPYAQFHYPFENKEWFEKHFPADFISEGDGQLRGWFYVLLILSTALFDRPAYKNCISYGVVVDQDGKKLSKRLKNYTDIDEVFNQYGSDALRWLMLKSPVLKGEELRIDKDCRDIKDTLRMSLKPMMNAYNFFCMYANSDGIKAKTITHSSNVMDKYILSKMKSAIEKMKKSMDEYMPSLACKEFDSFFENLNNWYIRRNKNRFWKSEHDEDKIEAYNTLYTVLINMSKAVAPMLPFTAEYIWRGLNNEESL